MLFGITRYPPQCGGIGTSLPSGHFVAAPCQRCSNSSRDESGADCAHCHSGANFENDKYANNGLDADADFTDIGREDVTKNAKDKAAFKITSLRNIAITAPYMHDGRFSTLEEVVEHYNNGLKASSSLDPALEQTRGTGLRLTEQDKTDLVNFLKTLTDNDLTSNPDYASPF